MNIKLDKQKAFKNVLDSRGNSYAAGILILEELIEQFNSAYPNNTYENISNFTENNWAINYQNFEERFGFGYYRIRDIFRNLERKYGLINRSRLFTNKGSESLVGLNITNINKIIS